MSTAPSWIPRAAVPVGAVLFYTALVVPPAPGAASFLLPVSTCAGVSALGAWASTRARAPERAVLGAGAAAGAVVAVVELLAESHPPVLLGAGGGLFPLAWALAGGGLGAAFGVAARVPMRRLTALRERPSCDATEHALFVSSLWLGVLAAAANAWRPLAGVRAAAALVLAFASAGLLAALAGDLRRILWLRAVARGRLPGWAIVADDGSPPPSPPAPMFARYDDDALDGYLVRRGDGREAAPFRESGATDRVAELPRDPRKAITPMLRRAACSFILVPAALWWLRVALHP